MSLLQYVKNTIYQASGEEIKTPDAYEHFGILIPESASTAQGVRPFPLPDDEHLFALFGIFMMVTNSLLLFFHSHIRFAMKKSLWRVQERSFIHMNI